jgi:hypothetical protein
MAHKLQITAISRAIISIRRLNQEATSRDKAHRALFHGGI